MSARPAGDRVLEPPPASGSGCAPAPAHVAIIMDGNGRWAKARGLPRTAGHRRGVETLRQVVRDAGDLGVRCLTLYSFSSENWKRPREEVHDLLGLLRHFVRKDLAELHANNVRVRIIGARDNVPDDILRMMDEAEDRTRVNTGLVVVIAFNYGARDELARAARRLARDVAEGRLAPADIGEAHLDARLDTHGLPPLDLVIRTGGEHRLSNFLLWQAAYAELVFLPVLWPDFCPCGPRGRLVELCRAHPALWRADGGRGVSEAPASANAKPALARPDRRAELRNRVLAAIVLAPAALLVAWVGGIVFDLLMAAAAVIVLLEWRRIVGETRWAVRSLASLGAVLASGATLILAGPGWATLVLLVSAGLASSFAIARRVRPWLALGAAYAGAMAISLSAVRGEDGEGFLALVWLLLLVWSADSCAYFVGRAIGGPKLWPRVSPSKTWSGAFGGLAGAVVVGLAVMALSVAGPWPFVLVTGLVALVSMGGDLLESSIKRRFKVKDAGRLIPGHGGLMDRVDSLVAASVACALIGAVRSAGGGLGEATIAAGLLYW